MQKIKTQWDDKIPGGSRAVGIGFHRGRRVVGDEEGYGLGVRGQRLGVRELGLRS